MPERIIDIHTHVFPAALARLAMRGVGRENDPSWKLPTEGNLLARMEEEKVACSVILPVVTKPANQAEVNRFAVGLARENLIIFGGVHPDCEHMEEELERLSDMGVVGLKFHPPYQKVHLEDEKYAGMWKRVNRLGLPVLIHCGSARTVRDYDLFPREAEKIIRYLPDIPVILAHMGGRSIDPVAVETLYRLPENVFVDTAMSAELQDHQEFERMVCRLGPERVLYGSDFPYGTQKAAIACIRNSRFSDSEKAKILGGNAAGILKL